MTIKLDGTNGITNVNGTAAAPAETGTTSTNTGLSFGTNTVTVSTAGSARATFDASGNLGIGTTSPTVRLHVAGATQNTDLAIFTGGGNLTRGLKISTFAAVNNDAGVLLDAQTTTNGAFALATAGTERMRIDSSGNVGIGTTTPTQKLDVTGSANVSGTVAMGSSFLRNRIINGAMQISQRGTSFSTPASGAYTIDRWFIGWVGAAPATVAQVSNSAGYRNALQATGAASNTILSINQRIESYNCSDLSGATVTFQANITVSTPQTVLWSLSYPTAQDNYTSMTTISTGAWSATATATTFTATITSLPAGAVNGLQLAFYPNNAGAFTSGTITITGVQFEVGTVATPFERRLYGQELALCQRYYEKSYAIGTVPGSATAYSLGTTSGLNGYSSAVYLFINVPFKVTKRTAATFAYWDAAGNVNRTTYLTGGGLSQTDNNNNVSFATGSETGAIVSPIVTPSNNCLFNWTASAEL